VFRVHHHQFDPFPYPGAGGESPAVGGLAACLPSKLIAKVGCSVGCSPIFANSGRAANETRVTRAPVRTTTSTDVMRMRLPSACPSSGSPKLARQTAMT
jgi:hypothetical protein